MPLNRRQQRAYLDTVDIWLPVEDVGLNAQGQAQNQRYPSPSSPSATNVACLHIASKEEDTPTPTGRGNYDIALTIDEFHFPLDVEITDYCLLRFTTVGHPDYGRYFVVKGEASDTIDYGATSYKRRANLRTCFANPIAKPEGFP